MKRIIFFAIISAALIFLLCSCSLERAIKNTEFYEDTATVTAVTHTAAHNESEWDYYHEAYKLKYVPEYYEIELTYKGKKYDFEGEGIYNKYKNKYGSSVYVDVTMTTYDDDTVAYNLSLK